MHMCSINMFVYLKPLECWGGGMQLVLAWSSLR